MWGEQPRYPMRWLPETYLDDYWVMRYIADNPGVHGVRTENGVPVDVNYHQKRQ